MEISIQDLGAIGELIGGVAVIASVIYLSMQIRHGIDGYKSNVILQVTNHFSNLQMETAKHDAVMLAIQQAEQGMPLDPLDQRRVTNVVSAYMIAFENMWSQTGTGMMDQEAYAARRKVMSTFMGYTGIWPWWQKFGRYQHHPGFVKDLEKAVVEYGIQPRRLEEKLEDKGRRIK